MVKAAFLERYRRAELVQLTVGSRFQLFRISNLELMCLNGFEPVTRHY
jgi:hypothetical protein